MKLIINTVGIFYSVDACFQMLAQTVEKALTLEGAKKVIAAALAEAKSKNAPGGANRLSLSSLRRPPFR